MARVAEHLVEARSRAGLNTLAITITIL